MRELPDPYVFAFLLLCSGFLLFFYNRLMAAVRASAACFRSPHATMEMLGNKYLCDSVRISLALLVPFYALTLTVTGASRLGYFWTLLVLVLLGAFWKLAGLAVGWLSSREAAFRSVERMGHAVAVLVMLVSLLAAVVGWLVPQTPDWVLWSFLGLVAAAGAILYGWRGFFIIFQTGFSPFFWVLYLCSLNFLPVCVVVNRLLHGN